MWCPSVATFLIDLPMLESKSDLFRPMSPGSGWSDRYNLDGLVSFCGPEKDLQRTYSQAFRDGAIEGVSCGYQHPGNAPNSLELYALPLELDVVNAIGLYFKALIAHGYNGPVSVMLTVLDVRGSRIKTGDGYHAAPWHENAAIDRDVLMLPDVFVEQIPADPRAFMRPVFDALWQSSGAYKRSLGYKDDGTWDEKKHRD